VLLQLKRCTAVDCSVLVVIQLWWCALCT